jgi:hypothetical protein
MSDPNTASPRRIKDMPIVEVRIEPNAAGTHLVWNISASDGTKSSGFAKCHADAMRDAAAFVEAMTQPRAGGLWGRPDLRVIGGSVRDER